MGSTGAPHSALSLCEWHRSSKVTHAGQLCRKSPFHPLSMYNIQCGSWDMQQCWPLLPCLQASLWRGSSGELFPFQNSCKTVKSQALTLLRGFRVFPFMIVYPFLSYWPISAKQFCLLEQPFLTQCLFSFSVLKRTKQRASKRFMVSKWILQMIDAVADMNNLPDASLLLFLVARHNEA